MHQIKILTQLKPGDVLEDGRVFKGLHDGYDYEVMFADGTTLITKTNRSIRLKDHTNCIYGGHVAGHSAPFCTARSCY
jgi:hypothetical protein